MDDWRGLSEKGELLYILVAGEGLAFSLESSQDTRRGESSRSFSRQMPPIGYRIGSDLIQATPK